MAKKKATTKKKTAKKSSKKTAKKAKKKETFFERKQKRVGKPDKKLLAKFGIRTCMLCGEDIKSAAQFEKHLHDEHETTTAEHDKLFPAQATAFAPYSKAVTGNQMYRAFMFRMVNGKWPEWYNGDKTLEVDSADPTLLRAAANMLLTYNMHCMSPAMQFTATSVQRLFETADAATMPYEELVALTNIAQRIIKEGTRAIGELAEVIRSTMPKEPKTSGTSLRMGFVAAGTIESNDSEEVDSRRQQEQRKHHGIAAINELTQQMQGFLQGGSENGPDVPSVVNPPKVIDVEVSSAETRSRSTSPGEEKKPSGSGDNGSPKR